MALYREFLDEICQSPTHSQPQSQPQATGFDLGAALQTQLGFGPGAAGDAVDLLATDEFVLEAFQAWLRTGQLDGSFTGYFGLWPCSGCVPHPTLGELLDQGADPAEAFLHLAYLAAQVDDADPSSRRPGRVLRGPMGWGKSSSAGRRTIAYRIPAPQPTPLRERPAAGGGAAFSAAMPADTAPLELVEAPQPTVPVAAEASSPQPPASRPARLRRGHRPGPGNPRQPGQHPAPGHVPRPEDRAGPGAAAPAAQHPRAGRGPLAEGPAGPESGPGRPGGPGPGRRHRRPQGRPLHVHRPPGGPPGGRYLREDHGLRRPARLPLPAPTPARARACASWWSRRARWAPATAPAR